MRHGWAKARAQAGPPKRRFSGSPVRQGVTQFARAKRSKEVVTMTRTIWILVLAAGAVAPLFGCNSERKQECDRFVEAMTPLKEGMPTAEQVDRTNQTVAALKLTDQPLHEYSTNYKNTLTVLENTLKLKAAAGPDGPPDGTDDVIKRNLKEARTDFDDISRYCAQ
jgi:hypothetical protein